MGQHWWWGPLYHMGGPDRLPSYILAAVLIVAGTISPMLHYDRQYAWILSFLCIVLWMLVGWIHAMTAAG